MSVLRATLVGAAVGLAAGLSLVAAAQAESKSTPVTNLNEGEAIMLGKDGAVHKSNNTVSADKHQAAVAHGAKEISGRVVVYRQAGKMYMYN